ncbi:MAG: HRDC domain-containing protein [Bacteroidota bacterium]
MENQQGYTPAQPLQIEHETTQVLKTVLLLPRAYSASYTVRVLLGDERFPLKDVAHRELETYSSLEDKTFGFVEDLVQYLLRRGFLQIKNTLYGTIEIGESGRSFLDQPEPIAVSRKELRKSWYDYQLLNTLRKLRKEIAEQEGKPPYTVFTNFAIQQILEKRPDSEEALLRIPGLENLPAPQRLILLTEITTLNEKIALDDRTGIYTRAFSPSHRKVKELFESGFELQEIAQRRNLQPNTVSEYLRNLARAGELDLKNWIEKQVESKALHRGAEYFRQAERPRLTEAHQVLGLDYDVLEWCRVYAQAGQEPRAVYAA